MSIDLLVFQKIRQENVSTAASGCANTISRSAESRISQYLAILALGNIVDIYQGYFAKWNLGHPVDIGSTAHAVTS